MSLPIASAARVGNVDLVSAHDDDLARPLAPPMPEPFDDEDPDAFAARAEAYKAEIEGPWSKAMAAFNRRLAAARATQTWDDVLKPDAQPVIFTCRPISARQWEAYQGVRAQLGSTFAAASLLLRIALVEIRGPRFEAFKMPPPVAHTAPDEHGRPQRTALGLIAPDDLPDRIGRQAGISGGLLERVVEDLGVQIYEHWSRAPVP